MQKAFERLEPDAGKPARPVLRGGWPGNSPSLPDYSRTTEFSAVWAYNPMEQYFGCPVACAAELDGVMIDNRILAHPPAVSPVQTQGFLDRYLKSMEADFPNDIVQQVHHTIIALLPISECRLDNVAKVFNLHPRVLQQRLSGHGTSFQRLLDEARVKIAKQYLRHTRTPLTEIALNLGFAELAVFSRAFRRWTETSPSTWRRTAAE